MLHRNPVTGGSQLKIVTLHFTVFIQIVLPYSLKMNGHTHSASNKSIQVRSTIP